MYILKNNLKNDIIRLIYFFFFFFFLRAIFTQLQIIQGTEERKAIESKLRTLNAEKW